MSLTDHLATTLRLDLSRSRWFALAPVEQVAIKSAEYNLEQARTKATTLRAFSRQPCAGLLRMCTAFRTSSIRAG